MEKDGGPAFPQINQWDKDEWRMGPSGMSLRDYFAAAALQGYLASWPADGADIVNVASRLASRTYALADAMLAERAK